MGTIPVIPVLLILLVIGSACLLLMWILFRRGSTSKNRIFSIDDQIRISKQELETVFDAITEAICIIDKDFEIVRVNKSYASLVGIQIKKLLGKRCYEVFRHKTTTCSDCPAIKAFASREVIVQKGIRMKGTEENKYFEMTAYPVRDKKGDIVHVIEFIREVTEEKRITEQLIRSEKLASIGIMTAGIAHEMNNPLSGISGTAVNLLNKPEKYGLNEKAVERVQAILDSAERAMNIMRDLLYLSRKDDSTSVLININSLINKSIQIIRFPGFSDIEQNFTLEKTLPLINCDPAKIEQVLINLFSNAVQSILQKKKQCLHQNAPFTGKLHITSQLQDMHNILITVSDNGLGIPDVNKPKIFDPFFSTRPLGKGTGLGLSISHKIIEEHGGRIFFDCIDEETIFSIVLPIVRKGYIDLV